VAENRVVAVFGYSTGRARDLHPICAERLAHAERIADGASAVVLSGWARRRAQASEAELMRAAWRGPAVELVLDPDARWTAGNAVNVLRSARELEADELVVVTSRWHRPRAQMLLRAVKPDGLRVSVEAAPGRRAPLRTAREAICFLLLPLQLAWASRRARR
jgi:hypothetical protein